MTSRVNVSFMFLFSIPGNVFGPGNRKIDKQPPVKKKRIDTSGDWMASDVLDIQDIDLEVYGRSETAPASHR